VPVCCLSRLLYGCKYGQAWLQQGEEEEEEEAPLADSETAGALPVSATGARGRPPATPPVLPGAREWGV
jgi:hypothetical protein